MRNPNEIAKVWLGKATTADDSYDKFVYLWFAFNSLYNQFLRGRESDAIIDLVFSDQYRLNEESINAILSNPSIGFLRIGLFVVAVETEKTQPSM